MLSEKNIKKIDFSKKYTHIPESRYRGELFSGNLYHLCNWHFEPKFDKKLGEYIIQDDYWEGNCGVTIVLTDENIDEFIPD